MPEVSGRTIAMAIQAIDISIQRLRKTDAGTLVPEDLLLLVDFENAAEELESAYAEATSVITNLPPYTRLIKPPE